MTQAACLRSAPSVSKRSLEGPSTSICDESADVLALLGQLLDVGERPGGVAVDDEVAEAEERLLLDRAEELEHRLHGHRALRRGDQLVERRDGIPV